MLKKIPQYKGICIKVYTMCPKKPNSALRKVCKVKVNKLNKIIIAYMPGEKAKLSENNFVLICKSKRRDLPGVNYKLIRNKYDFKGVENRKSSRSKYGTKKK